MICKTVAVAFSHYYTNNSLNKMLYKFSRIYILQKIVQKMSRIEEIFVPVYILDRIIVNAILYFFKTIAFSSRVIKVCSNSENITQTKRLFILRRKLERHVKICN